MHGGEFRQYSMAEENHAAQRQTAVTAHFTSKQLLLFVFVRVSSYCCLSLHGGQYASTRWQKRILQLNDKRQWLLTLQVNS